MQKVFSSQSRLEIVADILMDMEMKPRLKSGAGNAMLVAGSIYEACKFYELFEKTDLAGKCAIVTSYKPAPPTSRAKRPARARPTRSTSTRSTGDAGDWFNEPAEDWR
jgi:type I restriction enzyme R subunit